MKCKSCQCDYIEDDLVLEINPFTFKKGYYCFFCLSLDTESAKDTKSKSPLIYDSVLDEYESKGLSFYC